MKKLHSKIFNLKSQIGKVSKDSKNPFFKSKYMDLNSLLEVVEPLMIENKLLLTQPLRNNDVCTVITDIETGEEVVSSLSLPSTLTDPQKIGSCVTYFRRYTLKSLLSIQETDDDAERAVRPEPIKAVTPPPVKKAPKGNANTIAAVNDALGLINACTTLDKLKEVYLSLDKDVKANADVIAKKEDQKLLLTPTK